MLTPEQLRSRLPEFYKAVEEFNDGYYFESHETLEDLWMVTPLPERDFFQAIIQLAAAFVHYSRGEYPGILKLLDASAEKLGQFEPGTLGVEVALLSRQIAEARAALADLGPERFLEWRESGVPTILLAQ